MKLNNNFEIEIIDKANSIDELNKLEIKWINLFDCLSPKGYNLHTGGKNHKCSDITRERLRDASTGKIASEETKIKMVESGKNKEWTDEHKNNISKALKGRKHTKEHIENLPQNQKGFMSGEKHPRALLTNIQVIEIRNLLNSGETNKKVSEMFHVTQNHVSMIKTKRAYAGI